ncbi:MAG: hypothetical protein NT069_06585 [Planctomycetota bacterium]|nr:hypothetical protein [Planctomycetota bacterium]
MRRSITLTAFLVAFLSTAAFAQTPAAAPAGINTITVVLPSLENFYGDLKVPFDLAEDPKGYTTLTETLDVFIVGIQKDKPLGVRMMSSASGLNMTMSLPVKGSPGTAKTDPQYQKLVENLWDLDLKMNPPPSPALIRLVPAAIRTKTVPLRLQPTEKLMFSGFDGFSRRETDVVHIGKELADVRALKGPIVNSQPEGVDLAISIDGKSQKPEDRLKAFDKIRKELLGAAKKKEGEAQTAFDLRDGSFKQVVAELERFYAESSSIDFLWRLDNEKKTGALDILLAALPNTPLAASAELVKNEPSAYALVSSQGAAISMTSKLTLDPLRKAHAAELAKLVKNHVEQLIDSDAKKEAAQKTADKDSLAILFEAMADVAEQGELTGCLRSWGTGNGHFDTLGALKIPDTAKYLKLLEKIKAAAGPITVELNVDKAGEVEIHKIVSPGVQANLAEIIAADGSIYIGLGNGVLWYAAAGAPTDAVPPLVVSLRMGPLTQFIDSYRKRNPLPVKAKATPAPKAAPAKGEKKTALPKAQRDTSKSPLEQVSTLMGDMDLQKIASKAFTKDDDLIEFSLGDSEGKAHVAVKIDTGLLRFVGTAASKFVKDNLADE